jgi:hypothetical protein
MLLGTPFKGPPPQQRKEREYNIFSAMRSKATHELMI